MKITGCRTVVLPALLLACAAQARADVTRIDVRTRGAVGTTGYEKIVGTAHFAVDPKNARNQVIADIDKAPVNAAGKVEFAADIYIYRPLDPARSNGVALMDVVNRGRKTILRFNRVATPTSEADVDADSPSPCPPPRAAAGGAGTTAGRGGAEAADLDLGDEFLIKRGFTLVFIGWQFDVRRSATAMGIELPRAVGVTGTVSAVFTPCDRRPNQTVTDLAGYPAIDPASADNRLTVRDSVFGVPQNVARDRWTLKGNVATMEGGFEPGKIYEISYRSADPPIIGLGLAGFRDVAAWMKYAPDAVATTTFAYAFGSSQSGRFLREFLYAGFNTDEHNRQVYDAVMAHIAGAARLDINRRFGTPNALAMFTSTAFPFATTSQTDPISGRTEGLLENDRARANQPKIVFTNSSVEQWGGGRAAPLITTTADGKADLPLAANVRYYYFAGTQHSPGRFPPRVATGQQPYNTVDYWWTMRALLLALDQWVRLGTQPPPSQYPRIADGTLVPVERIAFPAIPSVKSPAIIPAARQDGRPLPFLVPQVDEDGNDRAGLKLPEVAVPLATYTGWNFRADSTGGSDRPVNLLGSGIPFPKTEAERTARRDPRPSIELRYSSREEYLAKSQRAADELVKGRYLLAEDVPAVMRRAGEQWQFATEQPAR